MNAVQAVCCVSLRNPKLRKPQSFIMSHSNLFNLCPRRRHYLYYTGQQTNLPSYLDEDSSHLPMAVLYKNILGRVKMAN